MDLGVCKLQVLTHRHSVPPLRLLMEPFSKVTVVAGSGTQEGPLELG